MTLTLGTLKEIKKENKIKELENFTNIFESAFGEGNKTTEWCCMDLIEEALLSLNDDKLKEKCVLFFLNNYILVDESDIIIRLYLNDMIRVLLIVHNQSTIITFCNRLLDFSANHEIVKLPIFDDNKTTKTFFEIIIKVLNTKTTPVYLLKSICKFLLLIEPLQFNTFFQYHIVQVIYVRFKDLWDFMLENDKELLHQCHHEYTTSTESKINYYSESISHLLFVYAHILSINNDSDLLNFGFKPHVLTLPVEFFSILNSLTSVHDFEISWSAACVLIEYSLSENKIHQSIKNIHHVVLKLISEELSKKFNFYNTVTKYNIPLNFLPLSLLVTVLKLSPSLSDSLNDINYIKTINNIINTTYNENNSNMSYFKAYKFSMCLTILSFLCANKDKSKLNISKHLKNNIIINTLDIHCQLLNHIQTINTTEITMKLLRIINISTRLVYSCCLLLRSMSRSASLLRTYFTSNNIIIPLMSILKFDSNTLKNKNSIYNIAFIHENSLQILVLGVISNLVIEFAYTRDRINIDDLLTMLKSFLETPIYEDKIISSLSVIRNALFGNDRLFKTRFLEIIGLFDIFKFCSNANIEIQIQSFNVLRNLLADSVKDGNIVYNKFTEFNNQFNFNNNIPPVDFVEFLRINLHNTRSNKLTRAICYCLIHLSASNINNKISLLKNRLLLEDLLEILVDSNETELDNDLVWEIKTCIAWIIINLTFKDGNSNFYSLTRFNDDEAIQLFEISNRSNLLINLGFPEALKRMASGCPSLDFIERAGKAIFQMMISSNNN